jgi:hypothetical protein
MYQNPRIHTSLISVITFSWLNHFLNELYAEQEEIDTYDLKKKKRRFHHFKTLLSCTNKKHCNFRHMLTLIIKKKILN